MPQWHFEAHDPKHTYRGAVGDAFFAGESDENPAASLVREAIQNSLGAHTGDGPVVVRFAIDREVNSTVMTRWFGDAWPHFRASSLPDVGSMPESGRVLVVEDFTTCGLEGDVNERRPTRTGSGNHFYRFFWAEALSAKSGQQGGRWGIGKTVFPGSSRIHSFLAHTIRASDRCSFLMGRTILNLRDVDGTDYGPDGHFGESVDDVVGPVRDASVIEEFARDFGLRRTVEPGLSIVVPYVTAAITARGLIDAVLQEYFWAVLAGRLVVQIDSAATPGESTVIDASNLTDEVARWKPVGAKDLPYLIEFSRWAQSLPASEYVHLESPPSGRAPKWDDSLFPAHRVKEMRAAYRRGERLAIVVPLQVSSSVAGTRSTSFKMFIQRDIDGRGAVPRFIRNDIFVPKARERAVRGHSLFAIIVVDDEPLSAFLGDAEPPAHSKWSSSTEKFKKAGYSYGQVTIQFVCDSPIRVAEFLSAEDRDRDVLSLADLFPQPQDDDEEDMPGRRRPKPQPKPEDDKTPPTPPKQERRAVEISTVDSGFRLHRGNPQAPLPKELVVRVAYDRSRGNALAKYNPADFVLGNMQREVSGARILKCAENRMVLQIEDEKFDVRVTGFDRNRDVIVQVDSQVLADTEAGGETDDQAE